MRRMLSEQAARDLRELTAHTEALVVATAGQGGEKIQHLRAQAQDALREARLRLLETGVRLEGKVRYGARAADDYIHDHPWRTLGMAAGAAFLLGYVFGRR